MFIRDFIICALVGSVILRLLGRSVGKVHFRLTTALWCSFIGQTVLCLTGFLSAWTLGIFLPESYLWISLIVALVAGWYIQAAVLFIFVRAEDGHLSTGRANALSAILIAVNSFITSPLIEFTLGTPKN